MVLRGGEWFLEWCRPKIGDERPPYTDKVNERFLVGSGRVNKVPGQHSAWWLTSRVIAPSGSPRAPIPHSEPNTHIHTHHIPTTTLQRSTNVRVQNYDFMWPTNFPTAQFIGAHRQSQSFKLLISLRPEWQNVCTSSSTHKPCMSVLSDILI